MDKYSLTLNDDRDWVVINADTMEVIMTYRRPMVPAAKRLCLLLNENAAYEVN